MAVIGHNFFKVNGEKEKVRGKVNLGSVNNNIRIKNVEKRKMKPGKLGEAVAFFYEFKTEYDLKGSEGKLGTLEIEGEVLWKGNEDKVLGKWEKEEKVDKKIFAKVLNMALSKAQIKALELSQDLNLPMPIKLPSIKKKRKQNRMDKEEKLSYIR